MKTIAELRGELLAKKEALHTIESLRGWGAKLLALVIITSSFHVFAVLGGIHLPALVHICAALLQVVGMELTVWFLLAARGATEEAGLKAGGTASAYFLGLNGVLNAAYFLSTTAGLPVWATSMLPLVTGLWVVALFVYIPVAVSSLEASRHTLGTARLRLLGSVEEMETSLRERETGRTSSSSLSPVPSLSVSVDARTLVVPEPRTGTADLSPGVDENRTVLAGLLETGTGETLDLSGSTVLSPARETVPAGETSLGSKGLSPVETSPGSKVLSPVETSLGSVERRDRIAELLREGNRTKGKIYAEVGGNKSRTYALIGEVAAELGVAL